MKRLLSFGDTTQETQTIDYFPSQDTMPYAASSRKRPRFGRKYSKRAKTTSLSARISESRRGINRIIIPRTVGLTVSTIADINLGFSFGLSNLWSNNAASTAINGSGDLAAMFDLWRIHKVEVTVMHGANTFDLNNNGVSNDKNLGFCYDVIDYNDDSNPTVAGIKQWATLRVNRADGVIRRTIYPRLKIDNGVTDMGAVRKNQFLQTYVGSDTDQRYYGWKFAEDFVGTIPTNLQVRFEFKIFYECMSTN